MLHCVDSDQIPHSAVSYLDLHCLIKPICPKALCNVCSPSLLFTGSSYLDIQQCVLRLSLLLDHKVLTPLDEPGELGSIWNL